MRRALLCLVLMLAPSAAFAADGWIAQLENDEGGKVMVASVAGDKDGQTTPMLRLMCDGSKGLMLRYDMDSEDGQPGDAADFLFENEISQDRVHMAYEGRDAAFAAYLPKTDPIIALLQSGSDVFVSESSGNYPAQTFSLTGSVKAIAALLKACK